MKKKPERELTEAERELAQLLRVQPTAEQWANAYEIIQDTRQKNGK